MSEKNLTRRSFISTLAVAIPAGTLVANSAVKAEEVPKLDLNDPAAKALLYVEDVKDVDTSNPLAARFTPDQNCANCIQIQGDDENAAYRPCGIFPGKVVASAGWCSVWAAKP